MIIEQKSYILNLWDTNGRVKFRTLTKIFIRNSKIVVLVYDITRKKTFEELEYWFSTVKEILDDEPVIGIVGNKSDLFMKEEVSEERVEKFAKEKNVSFKLISAKHPLGFNSFLEDLLKEYLQKRREKLNKKLSFKLKYYSFYL